MLLKATFTFASNLAQGKAPVNDNLRSVILLKVGVRQEKDRCQGMSHYLDVLSSFSLPSKSPYHKPLRTVVRDLSQEVCRNYLRPSTGSGSTRRGHTRHLVELFRVTIGRRIGRQAGFGSVGKLKVVVVTGKSTPAAVRSSGAANSFKESP